MFFHHEILESTYYFCVIYDKGSLYVHGQ